MAGKSSSPKLANRFCGAEEKRPVFFRLDPNLAEAQRHVSMPALDELWKMKELISLAKSSLKVKLTSRKAIEGKHYLRGFRQNDHARARSSKLSMAIVR